MSPSIREPAALAALTTLFERLTRLDVADWFEAWIPVLVLIALVPVAKLVLAIVRQMWLAGVQKMPVDRLRAKQRIETIIAFVRSVVYFALVLMAGMYALRALFPGFDPATATGALSIVALVLTGMFRDVVVDVVKGLDILLGRHYGVGDYIRVGNFSGYVIDFQLKYTKLRTAAGEEVIINNAACIPSRRFREGWVTNFVDIDLVNPADKARARELIDALAEPLAELVEPVREKPTFQAAYPTDAGGLILRYTVKVLPGADWVITDRFVPMVRGALAKAEIAMARDPQFFFMNNVSQFRELFDRGAGRS